MNLQWMGAILIIAGCGGIGFLMALNDKRELSVMEQLADTLDYMISELGYRMTPLPELCRKAAGYSKGCIRNFFSVLAQELENQIAPDASCCMAVALSKCPELPVKTLNILSDLGSTLGSFDLQGQIRGLEGLQERCLASCRTMLVNRSQRLRSYQTLGLCAGAALAILLL